MTKYQFLFVLFIFLWLSYKQKIKLAQLNDQQEKVGDRKREKSFLELIKLVYCDSVAIVFIVMS